MFPQRDLWIVPVFVHRFDFWIYSLSLYSRHRFLWPLPFTFSSSFVLLLIRVAVCMHNQCIYPISPFCPCGAIHFHGQHSIVHTGLVEVLCLYTYRLLYLFSKMLGVDIWNLTKASTCCMWLAFLHRYCVRLQINMSTMYRKDRKSNLVKDSLPSNIHSSGTLKAISVFAVHGTHVYFTVTFPPNLDLVGKQFESLTCSWHSRV